MNVSATRLLLLPLAGFLIHATALAQIGNDNPTGPAGQFNGNVTTGCSYDPYTTNATRSVTDLVVEGSVSSYPLAFTRTMNSRYTPGAGTWEFGEAGSWRHSYQWSVDVAGSYGAIGARPDAYTVNYPDGRRITFQRSGSDSFFRGPGGVSDRFQPSGGDGNSYLRLADGGQIWFRYTVEHDGPDGGPYNNWFTFEFMGIIDPYGHVTTITYPGDGSMTITEPAGRWLKLWYTNTPWMGDTVLVGLQASDGRSVTYNYGPYQPAGGTTYSYLGNVQYKDQYGNVQATAYYDYQSSNVDPNGRPLILRCNDPMFAGPMTRITYQFAQGGVYGQLWREWHPDDTIVSTLTVNDWNTRTENRGDGPSRTFAYSGGRLTSYTDFRGVPSYISYDGNGFTSAFTDGRGNTTWTAREGRIGALIRLTHPDGSFQQFSYTDNNNHPYRQTQTDEVGFSTTSTRDGNGRVTRIDSQDGSWQTFTYNGFGQVTSHRLTNGGTENFYYDGRGLKYASSDPLGNTTYYYYDGQDRLSQVLDPRSNNTWFQYNSRGQVTAVTHQDGSVVQYGYDGYGNRTSVTDELNHTTSFSYDDYRRTLTVTNALNQTASFNYAQDWVNSYLHTTSSVKGILSPMGKATHFLYDENWRRTILREAPGTADDAWTFYGYDAAGNLASIQDPRNVVTTFGYDSRNRRTSMTNGLNQTTSWEYNATNHRTKETRADGTYRTWNYDGKGRLWWTTGFAGEHTEYHNDQADRVYEMVDPKGAVYSFGYDLLNRKTSETYPPDAYGAQRAENWSFDAAGNLARHDDPTTHVQIFEHDSRNRQTHSYWWYNVGQDIVTTYDAASRVTGITTNGAETAIAFGYDEANRRVWEDQTIGGFPTHRVSHDRDADGNATNTQVPGWYLVWYNYTQRNQLAHIYDGNWGPWFNYSYDAAGNMIQRTAVGGGVNDSVNAWSQYYDPLNRPTMWENTGSGGNPYARSWYQYDTLGREVATWRDEQSGKGERFAYSSNDQLAQVWYNADQVWTGSPMNQTRWVGYNYTPDTFNRDNVNDNGTVTGYTANAMNQYTQVGPVALGYDGNFNVSRADYYGAVVNYDAQNHLMSATFPGYSLQCTYDGLGRCVKRVINGVTLLFAYDGWKPIVEWDGAGNFQAWNIYGAGQDEILWRYQAGVAHLRYHSDIHGNVTELLDWGGNGLEKYTYDVFGRPTVTDWNGGNARSQSNYGNRFMWQGREFLPQIEVYDFRNRFYDPNKGRFLQPDPLGFGGGDANLFRYCGGDPVNNSDPMGTDGIPTRNGNNINIRFPVVFSGLSPSQVTTFINGVQQYWGGQIGPYNVNVNVGSPGLFGPVNTVYVTDGRSQASGSTIFWNPLTGELGAGHEFGHAVGAPHAGNDPTDVMSGPDVLADTNSRASEKDVNAVLDANGKGRTDGKLPNGEPVYQGKLVAEGTAAGYKAGWSQGYWNPNLAGAVWNAMYGRTIVWGLAGQGPPPAGSNYGSPSPGVTAFGPDLVIRPNFP